MATKTKRTPATITKPDPKRDVTQALNIARYLMGAMQVLVPDPSSPLHARLSDLLGLLRDIDARTGRRDPSARKKAGLHQRNGK